MLGGTLLAVSANVLNQIFEIETDRLMERTANRPLVTGEINKKSAYVYSISLGLVGFLVLYTQTTELAAFIALSANIFYSFIYTLVLKPRTNQNIVIGGAAGAACSNRVVCYWYKFRYWFVAFVFISFSMDSSSFLGFIN